MVPCLQGRGNRKTTFRMTLALRHDIS